MQAVLQNWKGWTRKAHTILSVSEAIPGLRQAEYVRAMAQIQDQAWRSRDPLAKTRSFWRMEKYSAEFFKSSMPGEGLRDPALPVAVRPIAHCGMGIGAVEVHGFELPHLLPRLADFSIPDYQAFAIESIGAMLGVYAPGPFLILSRACSALGLIPMARLKAPPAGPFLEALDTGARRLLSHGFGRLLYFRNHSLNQAIRVAKHNPVFDLHSCVRGMAFAWAMVNSRDVRLVLSSPSQLGRDQLDQAFEQGLIYALVFWEWMSPGFIAQFATDSPHFVRRASRAEHEIALSRAQGFLKAFDLWTAD